MSTKENRKRSLMRSTVGGVMTDEVGAVTGDLEIVTRLRDVGLLDVFVRYAGGEEWYTVTGSPVSLGGRSFSTDPHERVVERLTTPGPVVDGNEEPVSLEEFFVA